MAELINRRDLDFMLYEMLDVEKLLDAPRFQDWDRAAMDQILDTAKNLAQDVFEPLAAAQDAQEPRFVDGQVEETDGVAHAVTAFADAGFIAASFDADMGGLQLPYSVFEAACGYFQAANAGLSGYGLLTTGNANVIQHFGTPEQKKTYLPPMLAGRWLGTMCLSEPQAGSSLSDITTRAEPTDQGYYRISGTKTWISAGENSFSENIVHLVLARIDGAPPGVKGISLFIVPKRRVQQDGTPGEGNHVALAGLNHKMGQRGLPNTVLNFGETGECRGYLVGKEHQGLACMFLMMNEARIGVGQIATMLGYAGYLYALEYAQNRPQGRAIGQKDPTKPQIMIIEHADIKRLLVTQKAYVEGALSLCLYCAFLVDQVRICTDAEEKHELELLLEILTPIAKSWPSEFCLEANKHAIQILGGYGYTREYPVERYYRDNRLNPIHEGTHGIQAIDVLGRKVRMESGAALVVLVQRIQTTIAQAQKQESTKVFAVSLQDALNRLQEVTAQIVRMPDIERALANATPYLDAFGHVVVAWMWLKQLCIADQALIDAQGSERSFYEGKRKACQFFYRHELPKAVTAFDFVASLDDTAHSMTKEQF